MLALKILIYAHVNCGFSGFASLKLSLVIQILQYKRVSDILSDTLLCLLSLARLGYLA